MPKACVCLTLLTLFPAPVQGVVASPLFVPVGCYFCTECDTQGDKHDRCYTRVTHFGKEIFHLVYVSTRRFGIAGLKYSICPCKMSYD